MKKQAAIEKKLKAREEGFDLNSLSFCKRSEYNALYDPNMRHFFQNGKVQRYLFQTGQIDAHGRVIDMEKNKAKTCILEKEFLEAERVEERRQKEEMEMRYRVQRKRFAELEKARKEDILEKLKKDHEFGKEIVSIIKSTSGSTSTLRNSATRASGSNEFFMTSEGFY